MKRIHDSLHRMLCAENDRSLYVTLKPIDIPTQLFSPSRRTNKLYSKVSQASCKGDEEESHATVQLQVIDV